MRNLEVSPADVQSELVDALHQLFPSWPKPSAVKCLKWRYSQVSTYVPVTLQLSLMGGRGVPRYLQCNVNTGIELFLWNLVIVWGSTGRKGTYFVFLVQFKQYRYRYLLWYRQGHLGADSSFLAFCL
jgi:hypothetical protein